MSGAGEPVQLQVLGLHPGRLDAAILLDGFNDMASRSTGCDAAAAFWSRAGADAPRPADLLADVLRRRERGRAIREVVRSSPLLSLVADRFAVAAHDDLLDLLVTLGGRVPPPELVPIERVDVLADRWGRCVRAAHELGARRGTKVFSFVQPNLHLHGSKPLSPEEEAFVAENRPTSPEMQAFYATIDERYAALERQVAKLRASGVPARSLAGVFEGVVETRYVDPCCHVDRAGSLAMADVIDADLARALGVAAPGR